MFASLATVLKEDMAGHLEPVVIRMLEALQSDEGVKVRAYVRTCMCVVYEGVLFRCVSVCESVCGVCTCVHVSQCVWPSLALAVAVQVHYDEPSMGGLFDFDEVEDEDQDDDEDDLEDVSAIKG